MTGWTPNAETDPSFSDYELNRNKGQNVQSFCPLEKNGILSNDRVDPTNSWKPNAIGCSFEFPQKALA